MMAYRAIRGQSSRSALLCVAKALACAKEERLTNEEDGADDEADDAR